MSLISPVEAMQAYVDAGLTTFDMADIYGPAEVIFGQFNSQVHSNTHMHSNTNTETSIFNF